MTLIFRWWLPFVNRCHTSFEYIRLTGRRVLWDTLYPRRSKCFRPHPRKNVSFSDVNRPQLLGGDNVFLAVIPDYAPSKLGSVHNASRFCRKWMQKDYLPEPLVPLMMHAFECLILRSWIITESHTPSLPSLYIHERKGRVTQAPSL